MAKKQEIELDKEWYLYEEAKANEKKQGSITKIKVIDGVKMYGFGENTSPDRSMDILIEEQERLGRHENDS